MEGYARSKSVSLRATEDVAWAGADTEARSLRDEDRGERGEEACLRLAGEPQAACGQHALNEWLPHSGRPVDPRRKGSREDQDPALRSPVCQ